MAPDTEDPGQHLMRSSVLGTQKTSVQQSSAKQWSVLQISTHAGSHRRKPQHHAGGPTQNSSPQSEVHSSLGLEKRTPQAHSPRAAAAATYSPTDMPWAGAWLQVGAGHSQDGARHPSLQWTELMQPPWKQQSAPPHPKEEKVAQKNIKQQRQVQTSPPGK